MRLARFAPFALILVFTAGAWGNSVLWDFGDATPLPTGWLEDPNDPDGGWVWQIAPGTLSVGSGTVLAGHFPTPVMRQSFS